MGNGLADHGALSFSQRRKERKAFKIIWTGCTATHSTRSWLLLVTQQVTAGLLRGRGLPQPHTEAMYAASIAAGPLHPGIMDYVSKSLMRYSRGAR